MTGREKGVQEFIDGICTIGERVMLRVLLFGCLTVEIARFVHWLWIGSPR
jgi:hypothetical protein